MNNKMLSAGIVVITEGDRSYRYLLLRAYRYWDFPKGIVETGESPLDAACREVREETGITDLRFRWGHEFYETEPYGRGKVARYYLAETSQEQVILPVNPELGRPEHNEYRWVSCGEGLDLLNDRVRSALQWARDVIG